jgi:hypothetical protein
LLAHSCIDGKVIQIPDECALGGADVEHIDAAARSG